LSTVAIIGAGEIGGAAAYALAAGGHARRVVIIDDAANAAAGKALDVQQAGAIMAFHALLAGTGDASRAVGCDVCVIADDFGGRAEPGSGEALLRVRQLAEYVGDAPIVFAGAAHAELLATTAIEARLPRGRLIGSASEAVASAITAIVALEAECSPSDIMLTVLGTPPDGLVVPWSEASIGGYALQQVLPQVTLARLDARVKALWPPGPYALGTAAAHVVDALLSSSRRFFSVMTQLEGEFGVNRRPGIVSARLGSGGIEQIRLPELTTRERVLVQSALGA
jgi:malate dehydrogenase